MRSSSPPELTVVKPFTHLDGQRQGEGEGGTGRRGERGKELDKRGREGMEVGEYWIAHTECVGP
eukprot:1390572-Rhodomonas_salina.1